MRRRFALLTVFTLVVTMLTTAVGPAVAPAEAVAGTESEERLRRPTTATSSNDDGNYDGTRENYHFTPSSTWSTGDPTTDVAGSVEYNNLNRFAFGPSRVLQFSFMDASSNSWVDVDAGAVDQVDTADQIVTGSTFRIGDIDQRNFTIDLELARVDGTAVTDRSAVDFTLGTAATSVGTPTMTVTDRGGGTYRVNVSYPGTENSPDTSAYVTASLNDGTLLGEVRLTKISQSWQDYLHIDWSRTVLTFPRDFGDAPDTYGTTGADAAQHILTSLDETTSTTPLMLGEIVDGEDDGSPGTAADGDGADEDGLSGGTELDAAAPSVSVTVTNISAEAATVAGWLDLNADGVFEAGERATATVPAESGTTTVDLTFPAGTEPGDAYLRLRAIPGAVAAPEPTGVIADGEVEDHLVALVAAPALDIEKTSDRTVDTRVGDTVTYTVTATNTGAAPYTDTDPATFVDDLSAVLDDATYADDATAGTGTVEYTEPRLVWQGPLGVNDTVSVTYSVTLTGAGDRSVDNVAFAAECEPNEVCEPTTPPLEECLEGGTDPATGLPCDAVNYGLPDLSIEKSSATAVVSTDGQTVTYTVQATNTGTADYTEARPAVVIDDLTDVIDDATLSTTSIQADLGEAPTYSEPQVSWSGALEVDQTVTITYSVTFDRDAGDGTLVNVAFAPLCDAGDPRCDETPPPPPECDPADENGLDPDTGEPCGRVEIPSALLSVEKTSSPVDRSTVAAGQEIVYAITFTNEGTTAASVDGWSDHLAEVLDDAEVTVAPRSTTLTVSDVEDGTFSVSGSVPADTTATVTYTVRVLADAARGDSIITNVVVPPGQDPPADCVEGDPHCTEHYVPQVEVAKTVVPESGSVVEAGDVLRYTLTIANTGTAPGTVDEYDSLAQLLDDAIITSDPVASGTALAVGPIADQRFTITGTLSPGQTVTVTYEATVLADGARGDNQVANFVVPAGQDPPPGPDCVSGDPRCTVNPVPELSITKVADTTTVSVDGHSVTYTVEATNDGAVPFTEEMPAVVIDDLSEVIDDASLDPRTLQASTGETPTYDEPRIQWSGPLGVGDSVRITYTVTYQGTGDATLVNVTFIPQCDEGDPTCTNPPPTPECDPADENGVDPETGEPCARVEIPAANLSVEKSSDPADFSTVMPGEEVVYTITFTNTGNAAADVGGWSDHLAGVLDDADVTVQPIASTDDLTVSAIEDGQFTVSGSVPAMSAVTVQYTVTVLGDDERGDNELINVVTPPGQEPPSECAVGDVLCTEHPVPEIVESKSVDPEDGSTVHPGDTVTYTLTYTNTGAAPGPVDSVDDLSHVLDDAEVVAPPAASSEALTASEVANGQFTVTGGLDVDQTVTVSYQVRVLADGARGDNILGNVLLEPGQNPPPDPECAADDPRCTANPVPEIVQSKSSDPASGTTVLPDEVIAYTLTFSNEGAAAGPVDAVDDVSHLLDDADISVAPTASDEALTITAIVDGQFSITGTLQPGQTVTVEYAATVLPDEERGDHVIGNFLLPPGSEPPSEPVCDDGDRDCTEHPVPAIVDRKSSDPVSGSTVLPGQVLTYTLTFDNNGAASGAVDRVDDLSHVLDDATVVTDPASSDETLTVSTIDGARFQISGTLAGGATATVTYQVMVDADPAGDLVLANYLLPPGVEPPPEPICADGEEDCTSHEVPHVSIVKSSDPVSGTEVSDGDVVTYTLSVTNTGAADGPVAFTDHVGAVLDDASMVQAPVADDESVTAAYTSGVVNLTGTIAVGATVTVTYTVQVLPWDEQGDHELANFVTGAGDEPPSECVPGSVLCTEHEVPPPAVPPAVPGLPNTGADVSILFAAVLLVLTGGAIVVTRRRRQHV
ncbi:GEVED domain-containing protein [Ruania alba]|uniref:DUF7927 domain-containing protein n=1 Tax=Ruania alba TaxID=648782 RepID=UPI00111432A6|nr:GEVED domain-containing protein [Ruania alba]